MKNRNTFFIIVALSMLFMFVTGGNLAGCLSAETSNQVNPTIQKHDDGKYTLEEASQVTGLPVPAPAYLPEGYAITFVQFGIEGVEITGPPGFELQNLTLDIEKAQTAGVESPGSLLLAITAFSLGMKIPDGVETFQIGGGRGIVDRQPDYIKLSWSDRMGRGLSLIGNKELNFEELVRIAQSVTTPPSEVLEVEIVPKNIIIFRGESGEIAIQLRNNSSKLVNVSVSRYIEDLPNAVLPDSITVNISDNTTVLNPYECKDILVDIKVKDDAPSPAWPYEPASTILPSGIPHPPHPVTEDPYYYLQFSGSYQYSTYMNIEVDDSFSLSAYLKIDAPAVLPAGMVTLYEAEQAADFPVAMLLPSYLPEGVNPPPIGYAVSVAEPHTITVYYSAFNVILSPEPGVSELPLNVPGERTTLHNKPVIIREDRIDWWVYDIHFAVVSEQVPISELKLIAESMMLVGPYSGSWLELDPIK